MGNIEKRWIVFLNISLDIGYGYRLLISNLSLHLMINGRNFTYFKSLTDGKWKYKAYDNILRSEKTTIKAFRMSIRTY